MATLLQYEEREGYFVFMRFAHSWVIVSNRNKFIPVSVSNRQANVRINVVETPYKLRRLYVGPDVRAT